MEASAGAAAATPSADPAAELWTVTYVVDGDTIHASRGGVSEKVRFIGIDTPEHGQCGFAEATANLTSLVAGRQVTLTAGARTDRDTYDRLLRYVDVAGVDTGLAQIQGGFAVARYDSRDGYGAHPREASYVAADAASPVIAACAASSGTAATAPAGAGAVAAPDATSDPAPVAPSSSWPLAGDRHACPQRAPIKGNKPSMIAHSPGQQSYLQTNPEACFASLADAAAAGFRPARR